MDALLHRLLSTMPYKLYWFDKTDGGLAMEYSIGFDPSSGNVTVRNMVVYMTVAAAYTDGGTSTGGTTPPKTYKTGVDTSKTSKATAAVTAANKVVSDNSGKSDYEKLKGYLTYITGEVTYNSAAIGTTYGDPWQLIYVFDNDSSTNVVCEGYAKAFKYLCDLSTFNDTDLSCYLVTGTMKGGTGEGGSGAGGGHMWNVVHIEGNNYLVDVTNCDTGTIGATDKLFLCGVREDMASEKYTATNATAGVSHNVEYEYDAATRGGYTADELKLSGMKYEEPAMPALMGNVTIDKTSPKIGDTLKADTTSLNYNGATAGTLSYQWKADGGNVGSNSDKYTVQVADYNKKITVTVTNSNNTGSVSSTATAAVVKKDGPHTPTGSIAVKNITAGGLYLYGNRRAAVCDHNKQYCSRD